MATNNWLRTKRDSLKRDDAPGTRRFSPWTRYIPIPRIFPIELGERRNETGRAILRALVGGLQGVGGALAQQLGARHRHLTFPRQRFQRGILLRWLDWLDWLD